MKQTIFTVLLISLFSTLQAQTYDLLLKGGHVIDPKNQLDAVMDVAIKDNLIAQVAANIPANQAEKVVDVTGLYVTPGLLDIHSHNFYGTEQNAYLSNGLFAVPPDAFSFRSGVTTIVDVGGAGWRNFLQFKEQTIDISKTRVLSFLNIVGSGMKGGAIEQNINDMDPKMTALVVQQHDEIVGIKVAHYSGPEWEPVDRAVQAGEMAGVPVMVDFGGNMPPLSIESLFMEHLRPGDIFTHTFAHVTGRETIVNERGEVKPFVLKAQERGIIFDVGHGGGSFLFRQAVPALKSGFRPNTISTDLHTGSMNGGMKDITNVMSKFLNMGMTMPEMIMSTTWKSAQVINRPDLGHMDVGAVADVAVFNLREGEFGFIDTQGYRMDGNLKLECELTIREGTVVWDLNGISRPYWITEN